MRRLLFVLACCSRPCVSFSPQLLRAPARRSFVASFDEVEEDDSGTVVRLTAPRSDAVVTLIGTAHLSAASNAQVGRLVRGAKPDVVVVELDRSRLENLDLDETSFAVPFGTSEGIRPPRSDDDVADAARAAAGDGWWWRPARALAVRAAARGARAALTSQYRAFGARMGGLRPGGEFAEAIAAANELGARCVLADRDSVATIERVLELLLRSGDPLGALGRLQRLSDEELEPLKQRVLAKRAEEAAAAGDAADDEEAPEVIVAVVEEMKRSPAVRERIMARWRDEVPEIARALLAERDFIMAEAVRRELANGAGNMCVVVGAGHLPGLQQNLEAMWRGGGPA